MAVSDEYGDVRTLKKRNSKSAPWESDLPHGWNTDLCWALLAGHLFSSWFAQAQDASVIGNVMILLRSVWIPFRFARRSVARVWAGVGRLASGRAGSGWIGALGRGFEFKTSFPGPGRLNLSGNPNFLLSVILDGGPFYVANSSVWWTAGVRNSKKTVQPISSKNP